MHFLDLESRNKPREPQPITNQIQKRTEPAFIEPMQCKSVTALPAGEKWTFEIKFDGYRCIAVKRGSEVTLFLATRKVLNNPFPKVVNALASLGCDFVRDGELVALDSQGSLPFRFCKTTRRGSSKSVLGAIFLRSKDHHRAFLSEAAM